MVALLACALALTAFADNIVTKTISSETYGTVYQLSADPGLDNARDYVSTLNTIDNQGKDTESLCILTDGTYYYVFPSSYIIDEYTSGKFSFTLTMGAGSNYSSKQKGINNVFAEWAEAEDVALPTFEYTGTWSGTRINSLVRFVVPTDVTYFDKSHCLIKGDNLVEVVFTHSVSVSNGAGLFNGNFNLATVKGFELVTNFSKTSHTFSGCSSLVSVKLPLDTTAINSEVFYNCISFTGVENWDEIKDNITSIGSSAFYSCDSLVSISLPSVKTISAKAFAYSDSLATVDLAGAPLTAINDAFRNCPQLDGLVLPETVTSIGRDALHGCSSLTSINVPRDCTELGPYAFNGCSSLTVIDMSRAESLKSTGQNTFSGTKVTELIFPEGFESFGGMGSAPVTKIYFPNSTTTLNGIAWLSITEFTVPLGVTSLGSKQFDYCGSLSTVTIHKGVTSINLSSNGTFFGTSPKTIIYTGDETDAVVEQIRTALPKATIVFADQCETYFGTHQWSGNATMQKVDYFKGVFYADTCTRDNCSVSAIDDSKTIGSLFTYLGYSYTEVAINGTYSMSQFYGINKESIDAYTARTGEVFEFGIVMASVNNPIGSEFKGTNKVLVAPQSNIVHDYFNVKVYGITENHFDSGVVFCAFVKDGGAVYYLDNGTTSESVTCKSYAEIKGLENSSAE